MAVTSSVLFCIFALVATVYGSPCSDLSGTWRNQLGSNMTIENIQNSLKITGQYNTSVESSAGASRISSKISGLVRPVEGGSLLAFNVLWNKGASITAWVGQCMVCDGQEKLHTTWILRSLQQNPRKRWMINRINQDTFWRVEDAAEQSSSQVPGVESAGSSDLLGRWTSDTGDSFDITSSLSDSFEGSRSDNGAPIFGRFDGNETYTALGFAAAHLAEIRGYTGHIYNPQETNKQIETTWLAQAFSYNCNNPRKYVLFGMDNYHKNITDAEEVEA